MAFFQELKSKSNDLQQNEITHSAIATDEFKEQYNQAAFKQKQQGKFKKCPRCQIEFLELEFESHWSNHSSEILPWLYLGATRNASNLKELKERLEITHILNCACEVECFYPKDFIYKKLLLDDTPKENITIIIDEVTDFIHQCKEHKNGKILVHCAQGMSRSVSMVIAYIMKYEKWTYEIAFQHVKKARSIAKPNDGFIQQLQALDKIWNPSNTEQAL